MSFEYVWLKLLRHRGWPWPELSFGNDPLYGEDGWCGERGGCGRPFREQVGDLVLQRKDLKSVTGVWKPNWQFDMICIESELAREAERRFGLETRSVAWPRSEADDVRQIVIPVVGDAWFDPEDLHRVLMEIKRRTGGSCPVCGAWRWSPVPLEHVPVIRSSTGWDDAPIVRSPEIFGSGLSSKRLILFRRDVAEQFVEWSPRDFTIIEARHSVS